jgi:hypothetical protein
MWGKNVHYFLGHAFCPDQTKKKEKEGIFCYFEMQRKKDVRFVFEISWIMFATSC